MSQETQAKEPHRKKKTRQYQSQPSKDRGFQLWIYNKNINIKNNRYWWGSLVGKGAAVKCGTLSWMPRTHIAEGRNTLESSLLTSTDTPHPPNPPHLIKFKSKNNTTISADEILLITLRRRVPTPIPPRENGDREMLYKSFKVTQKSKQNFKPDNRTAEDLGQKGARIIWPAVLNSPLLLSSCCFCLKSV